MTLWVLDSRYWIPDAFSGLRIPLVSGMLDCFSVVPDFVSGIPDPIVQNSSFHEQNFQIEESEFLYMGRKEYFSHLETL